MQRQGIRLNYIRSHRQKVSVNLLHRLWLGVYQILVATFVLRPTKVFCGEVLRLEEVPIAPSKTITGDQDCAGESGGAAHR